MKVYIVKDRTKGKLIDTQTNVNRISNWTVRGEHNFTETVIDPIRYHNRPDETNDVELIRLVQDGYVVFASEKNNRFLLAVKWNDIEILC